MVAIAVCACLCVCLHICETLSESTEGVSVLTDRANEFKSIAEETAAQDLLLFSFFLNTQKCF